ncbi:metal-dependent hydrolase [Neolewinella agarilytica]|uniref:Inner membrane protein n=1 Tax=Neolewinella agarilytica TaxID=478744 RepID=A0A1H9H7S9_9BACT|nr:metal-dependent hydrolase [Neolewinella agarilytica]SEQ58431.1 inner membrane protein [Neolewinella agarilytica]
MTLPNHITGGIVFTGVFGAFAGVNILHNPGLLIMTVLAATFADIDVPSSLWGRTFKPISKAINRKFGHRTITHSLLFLLLGYGAVAGACKVLGSSAPYPTVFLLAYSSHLLFDMMTVAGVPLFFPYNKAPCVIPSDPKLRLRSNNPRSEIAVFGFFLLSGIFLQPLMADGFWTSYNRLFGTMTHLQSEFEKADDVLQVNYRYREATSEFSGSGLAIECTGTSATLWNPDTGWQYLDASPTSSRTILEVIPDHTGQTFQLLRKSFVAISPDSLDRLLRHQITYQLQLSANEPFTANYATFNSPFGNRSTVRSLNLDLIEHLTIFELPDEAVTATVKYQTNPRIRTLEARITQLETKHQAEQAAAEAQALRIRTLETIRDEATDIYEEQRAVEELAKLRKKPYVVGDIAPKVKELRSQIVELQAADQIRYEEKVAAAQLKVQAGRSADLELTGMVTFVVFAE